MTNYTIQDFWKPRLNAVRTVTPEPLIQGWDVISQGPDAFVEAPLTLSEELSAASDPEHCPILLVSAPGAVGKTTLARQIAHVTGAAYIDLAKAEPVGANTLTGGLVNSELFTNWQDQTTAVLIDGLDEARLYVTQEGFEAFLSDVAKRSQGRELPTVLFGRTVAVQDALLALVDGDTGFAVLEIGYFGPQDSMKFAEARLRKARPNSEHEDVERKAVELLIEKLREQTEHDGDRFAGYAPVLQTVADRVVSQKNASALVAQIQAGTQAAVTLRGVVSAILERECSKLENLQLEDESLVNSLYTPDEQLDRLVALLYGTPPPDFPVMGTADTQSYDAALKTWVPEHPFLSGDSTSSAVFDAVISAQALRNSASADRALKKELSRGRAANPFLSEFYPELQPGEADGSKPNFLPPEHIGIVYASLRARLSIGDTANLQVEGIEGGVEEDILQAEVEITLARRGSNNPRILCFDSDQTSMIRMGTHVEDVEITVPYTDVEIGPGPETILVAPVSIMCSKLVISTDKIIVERPLNTQEASVFLEANELKNSTMTSVPIVREGAELSASWPDAFVYPWTSFAENPSPIEDERVDEALRRLRKFVIAFRSHGRGSLARYKGKIEHSRMTKGMGERVLNTMLEENILRLEGPIYFLDPSRLMAQTGANYGDCMKRRFGEKAVAFARRALKYGD